MFHLIQMWNISFSFFNNFRKACLWETFLIRRQIVRNCHLSHLSNRSSCQIMQILTLTKILQFLPFVYFSPHLCVYILWKVGPTHFFSHLWLCVLNGGKFRKTCTFSILSSVPLCKLLDQELKMFLFYNRFAIVSAVQLEPLWFIATEDSYRTVRGRISSDYFT